MNIAVAATYDYQEWLAVHSGYCRRLSAYITYGACQDNQRLSAKDRGDLRCFGCGGLDDQPEPLPIRPVLTAIEGGLLVAANDRCAAALSPLTQLLIDALQEILDGDEVLDDDLLSSRGDDALDDISDLYRQGPLEAAENMPLSALLLAKLHEYDEDDRPETIKSTAGIRKRLERKNRVSVYMGRCQRCSGFMVHGVKEYHDGVVDDEVYRCFNCGWRTSPAYDYNRKHPGAGWR